MKKVNLSKGTRDRNSRSDKNLKEIKAESEGQQELQKYMHSVNNKVLSTAY
jgi:hypothetical protein